jgi:2-polyprenyl-3-methyl-5-hydroxy-6-metoxy-1,4-benzoquinol methylase
MDYQQYFDANKDSWNKRTQVHQKSDFYGLEQWKINPAATSLNPAEIREIGDVKGKSLLHLQCHFGQDTLSFARMGARVTGCDLSDEAIATANALATEVGLSDAKFVCCNVYDLPAHLQGQFDIVFTSYGTIGWLPDLQPWAEVIAHFLKPGGVFYMIDFHPVLWMMDDNMTHLKYAYHNAAVIETEQKGTYADRNADLSYTEYGWNHSFSELLNSLLKVGLQVEFFNEYTYSPYNCFANTVKGDDGNYRIKGLEDVLPMVYSLKMTKPAS